MIEKRDFVITGLQSWDIAIGSNARDIALEISKNNRVLYVNMPLDQMTIYRKIKTPETIHRLKVLKGEVSTLRQINENLTILDFPFSIWSINQLPDGWLFDLFNKINNKKIFQYVKKITNQLGFKDIIHFIDNDIYRSLYAKELLKPNLSIYYRRDNVLPFKFWKKHAYRLEPLIIKKSDIVVCNSGYYQKYALQYNTKSYNIGQGVDLSQYNPLSEEKQPTDINNLPRPIVGYIGDITSARLDPSLIFELAQCNSTYSFVMVGKEDDIFKQHPLHQLKNVYFLGLKPKESVPCYMKTFDVCLNPQSVNEITIGNYPRKIDEYLALGKPVIATKTETMEYFKDYVYLCSTLKEYQLALDVAIKEDDASKRNKRILFANSHSWENNVDSIYQQIEKQRDL